MIHGPVQRLEEKDFVIYRSNGTPVFHFVNVVDDIDMHITHVIRGEDHLSNTNKHLELYRAFGVTPPKFAHIPLILKTSGPGKMSKRDSGSLVEEYRQKYFLPEGLINYLSLLGWSPKNDREIMSIAEIIAAFDLKDVNNTNARFDEKKLMFVNSEHVKNLSPEAFYQQGVTVLKETGHENEIHDTNRLKAIFAIVQEKLRSFEELPHFIEYFFDESYPFEPEAFKKIEKYQPKQRLSELKEKLSALTTFSEENIEACIHTLSDTHQIPTGHYIHPLRFAVSGRSVGPSLYHMLPILGQSTVLARIQRCLDTQLS